jgi:hypothetical protein
MKEMEAAEWTLTGDEVAPVVGNAGAFIWNQQMKPQDFERTVRDYDYRVEAGTARKPNKVNRVRQLNEFAQIAMPTLQQFVGQGVVEPYNALIEDWAKANDLDPTRYMIEAPPPPPPLGEEMPPEGGPPEEEMPPEEGPPPEEVA